MSEEVKGAKPENPEELEAAPQVEDSDIIYFSVSPWQTFSYGRWHFVKGVMKLSRAEAEVFRAEAKGLPPVTQAQIKEIDPLKGVELVRQHQAATQGVEGTGVDAGMEALKKANPRIGTKQIG